MTYTTHIKEILYATHNCDHQDCAKQMPERAAALTELVNEARIELIEDLFETLHRSPYGFISGEDLAAVEAQLKAGRPATPPEQGESK